ncbi:carboxypeptidase-like regulatory domain-containing protein [Bacteroidota bacterium]
MFRKILFVVLAFVATSGLFAQNGTLKGTVTDKSTGEPIPFATILILSDGVQVKGAYSEFDGSYLFATAPIGTYVLKVSSVGYNSSELSNFLIQADKVVFQNFELSPSTTQIDEVVKIAYKIPLIDKDNTQTGETITAEAIEKMSGRSVASVASTVAGVNSRGGEIGTIRGDREGGNVYMVDGIRIRGALNVPAAAREQVQVITGGLGAKYGNMSGGVINITTKAPTNKTYASINWQTTEIIDNTGQNILSLSLSGPLITRKDPNNPGVVKPLLGYFLTAEYSGTRDSYHPRYIEYKARDEVRDYLIENPIRLTGGGVANKNAEYMHMDEAVFPDTTFLNPFEKVHITPGQKHLNLSLNGKFVFTASDNINLTLGLSGSYSDNINYNGGNSMFNWDNNVRAMNYNYRVWLRFRHEFARQSGVDEERSSSIIKNAWYSVTGQIYHNYGMNEHSVHKDNLFDYGHVGWYDQIKEPTYAYTDTIPGYPDGVYKMNAYMDTKIIFTPDSDRNYGYAAWNNQYFGTYDEMTGNYIGGFFDEIAGNYDNITNVRGRGGLLNGSGLGGIQGGNVYGFYNLPGGTPGGRGLNDSYQYRVMATGEANILNHAVSFGFEYNQQDNRGWNVAARGLWTRGRELVNSHITQIDLDDPIMVMNNGIFMDTLNYHRLYDAEGQTTFDKRLREHLNLDIAGYDWINFDNLDPSDLSLEYFSPDELLNKGNSYANWTGYDAYGNRLKEKPAFTDFFSAEDEEGNKIRAIAPTMPIYSGAYIQDKFSFKELIFNVGVRVERYDNNQKVLRDPYLLHEAHNVEYLRDNDINLGVIPDNMQNEYIVYVDDVSDPSSILGFRDGSTWFNAEGTEVSDVASIYSSTGINPYLKYPDDVVDNSIQAGAFADFEPQMIVMPRISFSFPISDEALFFAHYDILASNNTGNINPRDYLYWAEQAGQGYLTNANLQPTKTTDYELGFQQVLTNTSSLKLSAYYREQRDLAKRIKMYGAYPNEYFTNGNDDFVTSKGFTIQYELRRTGNVSIRANYTLGFSKGSGASAGEAAGLLNTNQPALRSLLYSADDTRHAIKINFDYRFGSGRDYNGPKLFGKDILANAGANFSVYANSGRPYTKRLSPDYPVIAGTLRGARLPFTTTINMKADKTFRINWGKKEGQEAKTSSLNFYVDASNLLNTANITGVYAVTGDPDDDGYLTSPKNQQDINSQLDPDSWKMYRAFTRINNGNYSAPRYIRIGFTLSF